MVSLDAYRRNIRTEKRQAILEASLHIFLTQGFQNAGMAAIAKQADVSTATLYKHFSSKDQLFGEMVEMHVYGYQVLPIDVDTLDTSDLRAALSKVSEGFVNLISDPRTVSIFRTIIGEADRFPILQKLIYEKGRNPFRNLLVQFFSKDSVAAQLTITDRAIAAEWYIGLLSYWLIFVRVFNPEMTYSPRRVTEIVTESVEMFLARYRVPSS